MLEGDGVGIVCFNQDAQVLQPMLGLGKGDLSDANRGATKDIINGNGLDPGGNTSIGDGIFEGRGILNASSTFDVNSLVVLTDGMENSPRMIADVASEINEYTYAVGLGQPQNISVPALQTISGNNGGYLLITGAIGTDNRFLLQKYFLQILAGISNAEIVLDPRGHLTPGHVERVPFQLIRADAAVDVILLSPNTNVVDFRLQTPSGLILEPWRAMSEPGMRFVLSTGISYYRIALPTEFIDNRFDHSGTWYALLTIGRPRMERAQTPDGVDHTIVRGMFAPPQLQRPATRAIDSRARRAAVLAAERNSVAAFDSVDVSANARSESSQRTLPYSLIVHSYSNLSLRAHAEQSGFEPGAGIELSASLAESGIPLASQASVWAEVTRPNGTTAVVELQAQSDGTFGASTSAAMPGVHRIRIRARGMTQRGEPFTREKTLTVSVWRGGSHGSDSGGSLSILIDYLRQRDARLCELLKCLLQRGGAIDAETEKRLREAGVNLDELRKCISEFCRGECRCK